MMTHQTIFIFTILHIHRLFTSFTDQKRKRRAADNHVEEFQTHDSWHTQILDQRIALKAQEPHSTRTCRNCLERLEYPFAQFLLLD